MWKTRCYWLQLLSSFSLSSHLPSQSLWSQFFILHRLREERDERKRASVSNTCVRASGSLTKGGLIASICCFTAWKVDKDDAKMSDGLIWHMSIYDYHLMTWGIIIGLGTVFKKIIGLDANGYCWYHICFQFFLRIQSRRTWIASWYRYIIRLSRLRIWINIC